MRNASIGGADPIAAGVLPAEDPFAGPVGGLQVALLPVTPVRECQEPEEDLARVENHGLAVAGGAKASVRLLDLEEPFPRPGHGLPKLLPAMAEPSGHQERGHQITGGLGVREPPTVGQREERGETPALGSPMGREEPIQGFACRQVRG